MALLRCKIDRCEFIAKNDHGLAIHRARRHRNYEAIYQCDQCEHTGTLAEVREHRKQHPPKITITGPLKTCKQCGEEIVGTGHTYCSPQCAGKSKRLIRDTTEILEDYKTGLTLQAIGTKHNITRERVRQLIQRDAPHLTKERATQKRINQFAKKAERERGIIKPCSACMNEFWTKRPNVKYCPECKPFYNDYRMMTDPGRHERHRLHMAILTLKNPDGPHLMHTALQDAKRKYLHWREYGYLPAPDRQHYAYSPKALAFIERIGPERWAAILKRFDDYYADTTRRIELVNDPGLDLPGLK